MRIGYAWVSSKHQSLDRQVTALKDNGCELIFKEKASGKSTRNRPQLERALARLGKDDVFVVAEWDRATRSMMDGLALMTRIHAADTTILGSHHTQGPGTPQPALGRVRRGARAHQEAGAPGHRGS
jgi:DNA invertase Pin-like site-specific DNA recombinase